MKSSNCLFFLLATAFGLARVSAWEGEVTAVIEGDILEVTHPEGSVQVRLEGADCPEKGQEYSKISRRYTSQTALNQVVRVEETGRDGNRLVARIYLPGGRGLGEELIRAGMAWWDSVNHPRNSALAVLQREARARYAGLWGEDEPVAPWIYRNRPSPPAADPAAIAPRRELLPGDQADEAGMAVVPATRPGRLR